MMDIWLKMGELWKKKGLKKKKHPQVFFFLK